MILIIILNIFEYNNERINAPAEPLEEDVVALGAELDAAEQRHRRVALLLLEHDRVQVLDGHPPEDGPRLKLIKIDYIKFSTNQIN